MNNVVKVLWALVLAIFILTSATLYAHSEDLKGELKYKEEQVDDLKDDVKKQRDYINTINDDIDYWRDLYTNFEPKIEYITETEYIYINDTIWNNNTIYIDNAIYDVNRDGVVDYLDACEVLYYINHGPSIVETWVFNKYGNPYEKLYDVNRDGCVNTSDVEAVWLNCDM